MMPMKDQFPPAYWATLAKAIRATVNMTSRFLFWDEDIMSKAGYLKGPGEDVTRQVFAVMEILGMQAGHPSSMKGKGLVADIFEAWGAE